MLFINHIDEINNDDASQVPQSKLPGYGSTGLEISAINRIFQVFSTNKSACIDINRCHRFGLINNQIATRLQRNIAFQRGLYLIVKLIAVKQQAFLIKKPETITFFRNKVI